MGQFKYKLLEVKYFINDSILYFAGLLHLV
jgi:hypothetical protein